MATSAHLQGSVRFGDEVLFDQLELNIPAKQWTCLLGASGVGKSTILKLIGGLPTGGQFDGSIEFKCALPNGGSSAPRIAYMAQSDLLLPWLSVRENVLIGSRLRGDDANKSLADQLIAKVGLQAHGNKRPHQLSGGMRQRVALARTLMEDTPLVLLDEPFSALDARTRFEMQALAFDVLAEKTVLLVTHDVSEAVRLGHQLFVLSPGHVDSLSPDLQSPLRELNNADVLDFQSRVLLALNAQNVSTRA
ncbi:MAG: ABC transporter ATP-binding protein [Pseudomonadota bacterium]